MIQPREASRHFVSALLITPPLSDAQMGGYAASITHSKSERVWISTLHIRCFVSKNSFKVFDVSSHFHWAVERLATRAAFGKRHWSALFLAHFYHRGPGCAGLQQPGNTVENRWSILFSSVKTSLQRKSASLQEWIYGHDGNCWDLLVSTGLKSCRSTNYSWATFTLQINSYVNGRTGMKTWGWEEDYRALIAHQNFLLTDIKVCFCLLCSVNHREIDL